MSRPRRPAPFPTKEQVAAFIAESDGPVSRREVARVFKIGAADRIALKALMRELEADGLVERRASRRIATPGRRPEVLLVEVTAVDDEGEPVATPVEWPEDEPAPTIRVLPAEPPAPGIGDRLVVRLAEGADGAWQGRVIRRVARAATVRLVGVFRRQPGGGLIEPADRRSREPVWVAERDRADAADGELVLAEIPAAARPGAARARIVKRLGEPEAPGAISLIAIHAAGLPTVFPDAALRQAAAAGPPDPEGRTDLRATPLVTIDGADARDFDDAVAAQPDPDPANPGGWLLLVAIADVAAYVPPDSPLDREAQRRGNSTYFPDRVVPMLPEALSNGWCSLRPGEDRACLAVTITIDAAGHIRRHRFVRGLMRSAARLTYEEVQAVADGAGDAALRPLIAPLYGAYRVLAEARAARGTMELDLPERVVRLDAGGEVTAIDQRARLDSHRLIEEFMIAANVAAATTLQERGVPALYRVHPEPDPARVEALRDLLAPLGYRLARGQVLRPRAFTQILAQAAGRPEAATVSEMVLRAQAQAVYSPDNVGHFGLALPRYAHFTSPIRRYADLTVHRGLIRLLRLGEGGATDDELARLDEIGTQVSMTERRAAQAERDAVDRYVARYLSQRPGAVFQGRIGGVARFGLFVTVEPTGADGLVPVSTLPEDFYDHDEPGQALVGRRWGRVFRLGAAVRVRLVEADPLTGGTVFALLDADEGADTLAGAAPSGRRTRPPPRSGPVKTPRPRHRRMP